MVGIVLGDMELDMLLDRDMPELYKKGQQNEGLMVAVRCLKNQLLLRLTVWMFQMHNDVGPSLTRDRVVILDLCRRCDHAAPKAYEL